MEIDKERKQTAGQPDKRMFMCRSKTRSRPPPPPAPPPPTDEPHKGETLTGMRTDSLRQRYFLGPSINRRLIGNTVTRAASKAYKGHLSFALCTVTLDLQHANTCMDKSVLEIFFKKERVFRWRAGGGFQSGSSFSKARQNVSFHFHKRHQLQNFGEVTLGRRCCGSASLLFQVCHDY